MLLARLVSIFLGKKKINPEELSRLRVERLLVIRQHNQMGDMLLAVPAFRGLRKRFEGSWITLVAAPINTEVVLGNPYLDEVLTYSKESHRTNPAELVKFLKKLRRRRFDMVIVLNTVSFSITSMLLAVASGARIRVGSTSLPFGHGLSRRFYHLELPLPTETELEAMHESEHNLYPLAVIGVREEDLSSVVVCTDEHERDCERFLSAVFPAGNPFVVVHPGAGKKQNIWPPERFAEIADRLRETFALGVVAVDGPADSESLDAFLASCKDPCPAVASCPRVGFLAALMKRAALTLCNDTGIMHIAGAVESRCITVFGETDPARWKPLCESVIAVRSGDGSITSVSVDEVMEAVKGVLGGSKRGEIDL